MALRLMLLVLFVTSSIARVSAETGIIATKDTEVEVVEYDDEPEPNQLEVQEMNYARDSRVNVIQVDGNGKPVMGRDADVTTGDPLAYTGNFPPIHGNKTELDEKSLSRNQVTWIVTGVEILIFFLLVVFCLCFRRCRRRRRRQEAIAPSTPPPSRLERSSSENVLWSR